MTEMDCRKIEQLISPYLDGELTRAEADMVSVHLSACASCQEEYEGMVLLSSTMKNMNRRVVSAPPGFSAAVMQRIQAEEKVVALPQNNPWFKRNWKQTIAGVAAAAVLMFSTFLPNSGPLVQIADNPPALVQPDNPAAGTDNPATPIGEQPGVNGSTIPNNGSLPGENNGNGGQIDPNTDPAIRTPIVLASKDRALVTTLLEMKTPDAHQGQQKALALAGNNQAHVQNLGQQMNENGSFTVFKITVGKSQADDLISSLEKLGQVSNREVTKSDLNAQFADKLAQYQNLITQRPTIQNQTDLAAMDARITNLETELKNWDKQADQETIILWLQR